VRVDEKLTAFLELKAAIRLQPFKAETPLRFIVAV
jgi:hypothetical protein